MDYDKIIIELLGRIQVLEEKVNALVEKQEREKEKMVVTTDDIREYIKELKRLAKAGGKALLF